VKWEPSRRMQLIDIDENLWAVEQQFPLGMGLELPVRSHVVRLPDGGLLLFSPIPTLPGLKDAIDALGPVRALIAQSSFHHLGLEPALAAWPEAKLYGPVELLGKRRDLPFESGLHEAPEPLWSGVIDQHVVEGAPRLGEVAFFHRPTSTLLLCDLVFNVQRPRRAWSRFVLGLTGSWGHFGFSRLIRTTFTDRTALRRSMDALLAWKPARVALTHGAPVEQDATARLEAAFASIRPD